MHGLLNELNYKCGITTTLDIRKLVCVSRLSPWRYLESIEELALSISISQSPGARKFKKISNCHVSRPENFLHDLQGRKVSCAWLQVDPPLLSITSCIEYISDDSTLYWLLVSMDRVELLVVIVVFLWSIVVYILVHGSVRSSNLFQVFALASTGKVCICVILPRACFTGNDSLSFSL